MVIWLIGVSGAGKTAIGQQLRARLAERGRPVVFCDGDLFRDIMGNDLGHSMEDRKKNADRVCRFCQYLEWQGVDVIFAILSLFHESQNWNREHLQRYFEVYLEVSLETVQRRDAKGIYKKAASGDITNVVGVDIEFQPPCQPDVVINNDQDLKDLTPIVDQILEELKIKKAF